MKKISIILVLLALVLTACQSLGINPKGSAGDNQKSTPSKTSSDLSLEVSKGTHSPDQAVVVFQRSGGLVGGSEQWNIFANGDIVNSKGEQVNIGATQVSAILAALNAVGFYDIKTSSNIGSLGNCKDCYSYQLTVTSNGKTNTITFNDGDKSLPDTFWKIINQINSMISSPSK